LGFGVGALAATVAFVAAYETQLQYGNREHFHALGDQKQSEEKHAWAARWHNATRAWIFISIGAFLAGLWFARAAVLA
jgi:hypothetical protein